MTSISTTERPSALFIRLLGAPIILLGGQDITSRLRYRRSLEVLTFLALEHDRSHSRAVIADLFWPNLDPSAGRTNLRQIISDLNGLFRSANNNSFRISRDSIGLFPDASLEIDALIFERGCKQSVRSPAFMDDCVADLYQGPLLDMGGDEDQDNGFREWLEVQRQSLLLYAIGLVEKQCDVAQAEGNHDEALVHAQRLIRLEPSQESAHTRLIWLLAQDGQKNAAIRQFERLKTHLSTTLDAKPSTETLQLVEAIKQGRFPERQPTENSTTATPRSGHERRLLSCLYCEFHPEPDSEGDEELALEKLVDSRREATSIIRKHYGFVSDLHGTGLFAYFGFPKARERASELAVQAAQHIRATLPSAIQTRIGIYSGSLLVDLKQGLPDVFGQASELAMRLRLVGEIGDITVDEATHMATWREFPFEPMGARQFRGMNQTMRSWRISHDHKGLPNSTPSVQHLIGREQELQTLLSHWHEVREGNFCCVMVEGIAGIGKTRLVNALIENALSDNAAFRSLDCLPEYQSSPLTPITRLFEQLTGISNLDEDSTRKERLHQWFEQYWPTAEPSSREILMDILQGSSYGSPQDRVHARTIFQLLARRAKEIAAQQPLLIVFEDIHWLDRTSYSLLRYFLPAMNKAGVPIMLVLTRRSGYQELNLSSQIESLRLEPLVPKAAEQLLSTLDQRARLNTAARRQLTQRSAGIPLFIEELYHYQKNKMEDEASPNAEERLPTSLQLLLQAEIDELGRNKHLLMTAAAIGQEFRLATLLALQDNAADNPEEVLKYFCRRNLLRRGEYGYQFRHDMIRETAYQMLPGRRRQELHRQIAESLIHDQRIRDNAPELIAHHFEQACDPLIAIRWWHHAGQHAMLRQAELDAHAHFKRAHRLMEQHDVPKAKRLDLMLDYSESLITVEGYSSSTARTLLFQALAQAEEQNDAEAQFRAISGIWLGDSAQIGHAQSLRSARRLQALARNEAQRHTADFALGNASFWCGAFADAVHNLEKVADLEDGLEDEERRFMVDRPSGSAQAILCWALWFVDRPDDARRVFESSLANARRLNMHRLSCYTLAYGANMLRCLGDVEGTAAAAQQLLELADKDHFRLWHYLGTLMQAWAAAHNDPNLDGHQLHLTLQQILASYRSTSLAITVHSIAAEIHLARSELPEALQMLDQAIAYAQEIEQTIFSAEIHRLRAVCLAELDSLATKQVENDLNQAMAFATAQQSPPLIRRVQASQRRWEAGETDLLAPDELLARSRQMHVCT